ncbi:MAG: protein kinase domain-containing protein [Phaeodactylibacter xiamenensis]|nr:AAA family ATPase [Phaeodactylibacter xiamenensis]MCR9052896.1 AAA family ATPase [bacterium]
MKNSGVAMLTRSETIADRYTVLFFIKHGDHAETYRVKDEEGKVGFLKLFHLTKLHRTQFDGERNIKEIEFLKSVKHPNIVQYRDSGEWVKGNQRFAYLVLDFISGETLEERLKRAHTLTSYEVKQIVTPVLNGLKYLHSRSQPLVHNDINHQNIMLDLSGNIPIPKIIDFGYARAFHNSTKVYYRQGLNPYYLAPECFNSIFSPQSDLFSVGALMFHLLTGLPPWFVDLSDYKKNNTDLEEVVLEARKKKLKIPYLSNSTVPSPDKDQLLAIAKKAMETDINYRFQSAEAMLRAIEGDFSNEASHPSSSPPSSEVESESKAKKAGGGFNEIAGMDELKEVLYHDVIRALEEKELYEEYGLTIPNGMLLYGPPGCGKSFFAQKLAEEVGYNYVEVKPSELASIYVHGSQEKIGKLFDEARKNAPTILNFEEFDALVPNRDSHAGNHQSGEVNEFLAQLNNCGKEGIFVIATTNQPGLIDPAVLRAGRIDKIFFVPPPDFKARKELFKLLLKKRPLDFGIDFDLLAEKTENYVAIDIEHLVNEASREALKSRSKITQDILLGTIQKTRPSVRLSEIQKYEQIKGVLEGQDQRPSRPRIGFRTD